MSVDSGWGRLTWGQAGWNEATVLATGFGAKSWNDGAWGDLSNDQANLVGQQADTSLGTITLDVVSIAEPTGQEITSSIGTPVIDTVSIFPVTGQEITSATGSFDLDDVTAGLVTSALSASVGTVDAQNVFPLTGQEAQSQLGSPEVDGEIVVSITGQQADFATPVLEYAGTLVGWGRDAWGDLSWGDSTNKVVDLVGLQASVSLGQVTEIVSAVLNGQEATTNLGSINFVISPTQALDGQEATASQGDPTLEFAYTLSSQVGTTSLGTAVTEIGVPVTGLESTTDVGSVEVGSVELVNVTGVAATSSVGSIEYELTHIINGQETAGAAFEALADAQLSTAQKKFGTASLLLDGTQDRIQATSDVTLGTDNFTWETFARFNALSSTQCIWDGGENVGLNGNPVVYITPTNLQLSFAGGTYINAAHGMSTDTWHHIAITRNSGTVTAYIDGTSIGSQSIGAINCPASEHVIGGNYAGTFTCNAYIDETRLTQRVVYSGNFTPPTSAFTVNSADLFLMHYDGSNGSTVITNEVSSVFAFQADTSTGSFDIADVVQGLITDANTTTLGILGIQHFENLPTGSNTSYSNVAAGANSSITGVDTGSNTSYNDATTGSNSSISDVATGSNTSYTDAA